VTRDSEKLFRQLDRLGGRRIDLKRAAVRQVIEKLPTAATYLRHTGTTSRAQAMGFAALNPFHDLRQTQFRGKNRSVSDLVTCYPYKPP
jgi:hypothetical protein